MQRAGRVEIAAYDPGWPGKFEAEREMIFATCGREPFVAIEHVGSTAVPGLGAKPIIDMMPGLRRLADAGPLIEKLATIGYRYRPETELPDPTFDDPGTPIRRYFTKETGGVRAFHMHMVEVSSSWWDDHLLFRDYLRGHPDAAVEYERLKRELAARYNASVTPESNINAGYTTYKTNFVRECLRRARQELADR